MRLDDLINTTLGRYQIEALIGRGGMAAVYRAFDPALQRQVALKVLYPQYLADADLVERFRREAVTAAKLDHPNIAQIYDVGESNGLVYLALKLLPGPTLADTLQREGKLAPARVAAVARELAEALDEAHRQGVIHRDIKPGNVLFDQRGRAILTDFGIAKSLDVASITETSVIVGTPDYIAPEQVDPRLAPGGIDGRADIYAFGAMVYRALSGRRPFEGGGQAVLLAHLRDMPKSLHEVAPQVPPEVDAVVMRAMAKNPADRYATATEFAAALEAALGDVTGIGTIFPPAAVRTNPHHQRTTESPVVNAAKLAPPVALAAQPAAVSARKQPPRTALVAVVTLAVLLTLGGVMAQVVGRRSNTLNGQITPTVQAGTTQVAALPTASATHTPAVTAAATSTAGGETASATAAPQTTESIATNTPGPTSTLVPTVKQNPTPLVIPTKAAGGVVVQAPTATPRPTNTPVPPTNTPRPASTNTPRPAPTNTPRPAATNTPRPAPTNTPQPAPTNTPKPVPTNTPATLACANPLTGGFGKLWEGNARVQRALGCPTMAEAASAAAEQVFQGGLMYWLAANQRIYVLHPNGAGSWAAYANTYVDGEQLQELNPPPGKYAPVRGFGKLWRTNTQVSEELDWGTTPEVALSGATSGVYQRFDGGTMLYSWAVNGHGRRIYVLFKDGTFATYPDPE